MSHGRFMRSVLRGDVDKDSKHPAFNYAVPTGYTHFKAKGALDDSCTDRGADRAKVRFSVHK